EPEIQSRCNGNCGSEYIPICGNDERTYINHCWLTLEMCLYPQKNLSKQYSGECVSGALSGTELSEPERLSQTVLCEQICPERPDLVCDNKNITHLNFCELERARCLFPGNDIKFEKPGPCEKGCSDKVCSEEDNPVCDNKNRTHQNYCMLEKSDCLFPLLNIRFQHPGECGNGELEPECNDNCGIKHLPVCGTNNKTYPNPCWLDFSSCQAPEKNISIKHLGECEGNIEQQPRCNNFCGLEHQPVCGRNGNTYPNPCWLNFAACRAPHENIEVKHFGECEATEISTPHCKYDCGTEHLPVCGTNDKTYPNPCWLNLAACQTPEENITINNPGNCDGNEISTPHCNYDCGTEHLPVCGTNDKTYPNPCWLNLASCQIPEENIAIKNPGNCEANEISTPHCNYDCGTEHLPVCGTNDKTYPNPCWLNLAACQAPEENIAIKNRGNCVANEISTPHCNYDCGTEHLPVCGTNDKTYPNPCWLNLAACQTPEENIAIKNPGNCEAENEISTPYCNYDCGTEHLPVCGTNDKTYPNPCWLNFAACQTPEENIAIKNPGNCDANEISTRHCNYDCGTEHLPVCGTNDKIYPNPCWLNFDACQTPEENIAIKILGNCDAEFVIPTANEISIPHCHYDCGTEHLPVCGTNDKTYPNPCWLNFAACQTPEENIAIKNNGNCEANEISTPHCNYDCGTEHLPVCGTNDKTYPNPCWLNFAACQTPEENIAIKNPGNCEANEILTFHCNYDCGTEHLPVCGTNDKTYPNPCWLNLAACQIPEENIAIKNPGNCEVNEEVTPKCNDDCGTKHLPVCGTNHQTYINLCWLQFAACEVAKNNITMKHPGKCEEHSIEQLNEVTESSQSVLCDQDCSSTYDPVCDNKGHTHTNFCFLEKMACLSPNENIVFRLLGECEHSNVQLNEVTEASPSMLCNQVCSSAYDPVCDNKGHTHNNFCLLEKMACLSPEENLVFRHPGEC
ncbi:unnamed protein product, partial [Meganyctiphanes norvegica]